MPSLASLEQLAIDLARRGDFGAEARRVNQELVALAPSNEGAWTRLGRCWLEGGSLDEAMAALDAALQVNPQNTIARNLQQEVTRRRMGPIVKPAAARRIARPAAVRRESPPSSSRALPPAGGGFGRPEFAALAELVPPIALEALTPRIEAFLMLLNDRPFAAKIVETRNRGGQAGSRLFRRNSFYSGGNGHIFAHQHGGRREPQVNVGWLSAARIGVNAIRAGIGFDLAPDAADPDHEAGQARALGYFERFQRLVSTAWRDLLVQWIRTSGAHIQRGAEGPSVDLLPDQAVAELTGIGNPAEAGWVFCGRWLFANRPEHAAIMEDQARLTAWTEATFTDLLPLWTSIYRG